MNVNDKNKTTDHPDDMVMIKANPSNGLSADYLVGRYPVTGELWQRVYEWGVSHDFDFSNEEIAKADDHPVVKVNWDDCVTCCKARSLMDGLKPVDYKDETGLGRQNNGYRLLTDYDWMNFGCCGDANRFIPVGGSGVIKHEKANYRTSTAFEKADGGLDYHPTYSVGGRPFTNPVDAFPPNAWGLHDFAGNVYEWTCTPGPDNGNEHCYAIVGGSWRSYELECSTLCRERYERASHISDDIGFRIIRRIN